MGEASKVAWRVYERMSRALQRGTGVRISADELECLYQHDHAIMAVIENIRDGQRDDVAAERGSAEGA